MIQQQMQALCDSYVAAYRAGDGAGCAAVFTEDGILHSAYAPPAKGRAAIAALHEHWTQVGAGKTLTVMLAAGSEDVAWFLADFAEGHETGEGASLCTCTRARDGKWLIRVCSLTAA